MAGLEAELFFILVSICQGFNGYVNTIICLAVN